MSSRNSKSTVKQKDSSTFDNRSKSAALEERLQTWKGRFKMIRENLPKLYAVTKPTLKLLLKSVTVIGVALLAYDIRKGSLRRENRSDARFLADLETNRLLQSRETSRKNRVNY